MANTPRSRKAKGRRLQNEVRDRLLELYNGTLEEGDIKAALMGESGTDIKLSPLARKYFPYSTECKNQEKLNIWGALEQAELNNRSDTSPIVIFKRNRSKTYVALEWEAFLKLILLPPTVINEEQTALDNLPEND